MKNLPKIFIKIGELEISLITGRINDQNTFELLEKLILPINGLIKNGFTDFDKITNLIKKNVLILEQKVNYTFKDIIIILDNLEISFLNLCGFKKLNGTQISKETITYILNSLKSYVDEFEKNKKILHIFNTEYCLDKKKLDNLPIGLFGEFYYHELSFNLINKNDYKNLENIFKQCNLNIKKLLLESFVKGSLVSNTNPKIDTFFYIQIENNNSKIFYFENNVIKFEQKFKFGTEIVEKDISKITSLSSEIVKKIIELNPDINNATDDEIIESNFFINDRFRKIKKRLIYEIAKARIKEFSEIFYFNNVNFRKILNKIDIVFLEINSQKHLSCFEDIYLSCFASKEKFRVETAKKPSIERLIESAYKITKFGWSKEAIPTTREKSSYIARFFQALFK